MNKLILTLQSLALNFAYLKLSIVKSKIKLTALFIISVLIMIPLFGNAQFHIPQLKIPKTEKPPVIDGKISEVSWQKSYEVSDLIIWTLDNYVKDAVQVFLCHDNLNLYVAFRCKDSIAGKLKKTVSPRGSHDTFLWGKDFAMVGIQSKALSYQVMADPKGTMTDFKNNDIRWNGKWRYEASINDKDWTAEFSIPLDEAGLKGLKENQNFTLSLSRSYPAGESAKWTGTCNLSNQNIVSYQFGRWPEPVPGRNFITFSAKNFSAKKQNIKCELELIPLKEKPAFK